MWIQDRGINMVNMWMVRAAKSNIKKDLLEIFIISQVFTQNNHTTIFWEVKFPLAHILSNYFITKT